MGMRGYKAMRPNMTCRGLPYEVGKTYEVHVLPRLCRRGFHFCEQAADVWRYYNRSDSIVCEVEALGATDRIRIVRRLTPIEEGRLRYGCGTGYGYGLGYGSGDGNGNGNGNGDGYGYGLGYGRGDGRGHGDGYGCDLNMNHYMVWGD